ncbi:protein kinase domain-containing protein [Aspergillus undulatus]|uniref:protein kinase domain-containing protein n=1 Tax=Aspergillus undulatus TaxID=1810928 RepID=UPI003CCDE4BC
MSTLTSVWWPEDRVKATICPDFVFKHLPSGTLPRLVAPLPWGEGLTSETYLDWILAKAGRLFLILLDIGIPERIFHLVDESFDDNDLPIAAHSVDRLQLSAQSSNAELDSKFFLAQWRFVVRGISEGEHVKYTENEGVPVEVLQTGTVLVREGVERVVLAGAVCKIYLRTQVTIGGAPHFFEQDEVLEEIRSMRRLAHDHVYSIYASYFADNTICILFSGVYERNLMAFLTDTPQAFKKLPKERRREILVNWPHCLAHGLSWLHAHGQVHGLIRPSNILIGADFKIFIGQFEALDTLLPPVKVDDVESYQYGPPERWVRSISVQNNGPAGSTLPSGGRTGRKIGDRPGRLNLSTRLKNLHVSDPEALSPPAESIASHGTDIRVGNESSRYSMGLSSSSGSSNGSTRKRGIAMKRPLIYTPSITSSNSSGSSEERGSMIFNSVGVPTAHTSGGALVQVWQSRQTDPEASDIFSLGAVFLDIFTYLCKRKISSFSSHRGAKNRTAGRGGGVADCSFHLDRNIGQVSSWITLLDSDAKKRKDPIFQATRPMLAMSRDMVSRDPGNRPSAFQVEQLFACSIKKAEGKVTLCCSSNLNPGRRGRPDRATSAKDAQLAVPRIASRSRSRSTRRSKKDQSPRKENFQDKNGLLSPTLPSAPQTYLSSSDTESYTTSDTDPEPSTKQTSRRQGKKKSSKVRGVSPDTGSSPVLANDPSWDYATPWMALKT